MADAPAEPPKQERAYVRLQDTLPFSWRAIAHEEYKRVMDHFNRTRTFPPKEELGENTDDLGAIIKSLDITEHLVSLERADPVLAKILGQLDKKLNTLLQLFLPEASGSQLLPTPVNLSGGGIAFWAADHGLEKEQVLELRIALSKETLAAMECYVVVVAIIPDNMDGMDKIACRYEPILDPDRERIIQFIFRRQAEQARAKRDA